MNSGKISGFCPQSTKCSTSIERERGTTTYKRFKSLRNRLVRKRKFCHHAPSILHIVALFLIQQIMTAISVSDASDTCSSHGETKAFQQTFTHRFDRIAFLHKKDLYGHRNNRKPFKWHIASSTPLLSSSFRSPISMQSAPVAILYSTAASPEDTTTIGRTLKNDTNTKYMNTTQNNIRSQIYNRTFPLPINTQVDAEHHPSHHNLLSLESIKSLWRWRNNNTNQSFIEVFHPIDNKESKLHQLSNLLEEHALYASQWDEFESDLEDDRIKVKRGDRNYAAWTIAGLIMALAEEVTDLDVEVDANYNTPLRNRTVDSIRIQFSKLGFKPLRMRGSDKKLEDGNHQLDDGTQDSNKLLDKRYRPLSDSVPSPDEAFDQIDTDNSGALDVDEVAIALRTAAIDGRRDGSIAEMSTKSLAVIGDLARRLVRLYDSNGDGVVDRDEYKDMVKDMTTLRSQKRALKSQSSSRLNGEDIRRSTRLSTLEPIYSWVQGISTSVLTLYTSLFVKEPIDSRVARKSIEVMNASLLKSASEDFLVKSNDFAEDNLQQRDFAEDNLQKGDIIGNDLAVNDLPKGEIIISGLSLDLRRLLFGAVPIVKKITPGGPLILDPFKVTVAASFNREDIMSSNLLDAGLRQLVARALRRRVRSWRDFFDGAVFYGRTWTMASIEAPFVEVPQLSNVDFDEDDRLILTGRARFRASPDQPLIENSFKLRTRLGTRENGQFIRLQDPELAIGLECPKDWEMNIKRLLRVFNINNPTRPKPVDIFFPLVSPLKATDQDGFNLGEDNRINSIFIKDGALHFEVSSTLRPGRFLGNHYIAFVVPNRTFIITMDRVLEGIRVARRNKREQKLAQRLKEKNKSKLEQKLSDSKSLISTSLFTDHSSETPHDDTGWSRDVMIAKRPNFISRFLEGYMEAAREETDDERSERMARALSKFFGTSAE